MPFGAYIQVPFCQSKCTYCNFHTGVFSAGLYSPYVEAVSREISEVARQGSSSGTARGVGSMQADTVDTIYVGGGTPSLLDPGDLQKLLEALRDSFGGNWQEVTLEADPETITPDKADAWRRTGFNRISMGVQSFHDIELKAAGRMHRKADVYTANRILREAGFANLSFDLIAGLPHQTPATWKESVEQLIDLRPEHVSVYLMEIDGGSRLGKEVLAGGHRYSADALPSDEQMADSYDSVCEALAAAGYEHYEISNWGLPGRWSQHNLKYWKRQPYLGFGAGAHSFDGKRRWANAHDPATYVAAIQKGQLPREQQDELTPQQALDEELFLGLRLLDGINLGEIEKQYQVKLEPRLARLREEGYVEVSGQNVRLAPSRLAVSNEVFVELMG